MYEYEATASADKSPGVLEELDRELNELEEAVERLSQRLGPITNQYGSEMVRTSEPRPEPSSQFRGRIERLRTITERVRRIIGDLDL